MKRLFLFTLTGLFAYKMQAQPVITHDQYILTYTDSINIAQAPDFNPGGAGADVTWNFANAPAPAVVNVQHADYCPGGDAICAQFPSATSFILTTTAGQPGASYTMLQKTTAQVESIGGQNSTDPAFSYSDPQLFVKFPITYGQSYSDRYAISNSQIVNYGTKTYVVDGYGTVITPNGTYTDVLRQKIITYDTMITSAGTIISIGTGYTWLKAGQTHAIFTILEAAIVAPVAQSLGTTIAYSKYGPTTTGITGGYHTGLPVVLSPNPAADGLAHITAGLYKINRLKITDIAGKAVDAPYQSDNGNGITLQTSTLPAGLYLVTVFTDKGTAVKKLVIHH